MNAHKKKRKETKKSRNHYIICFDRKLMLRSGVYVIVVVVFYRLVKCFSSEKKCEFYVYFLFHLWHLYAMAKNQEHQMTSDCSDRPIIGEKTKKTQSKLNVFVWGVLWSRFSRCPPIKTTVNCYRSKLFFCAVRK